jgi:c(7)-type cytochrome triheme protein
VTMRALALALVAVLAGIAAADAPRGFDHTLHARDVDVSGASPIACAHCHDVDPSGRLVGKPSHAACFGACHGTPPRRREPMSEDRARVCTACHAPSLIAPTFSGRVTVPFPPYTLEHDFNLAFGHKQHAAAPCTQCHDVTGGTKRAPHTRCASCHDGQTAIAMTACETCHPAAAGAPQPPELRALHDTIGAIFSHARHAARGGEGRDCTTCHAAIAETNARELPRPTVADCARCHDGKQAFATTIACTRCHAAPTDAFDVWRPEARFRHSGEHAQLVANKPCNACHALDASGDATAPGHAACTGTACHTSDLGARKPKTCGACHISTEPWRHLHVDRPPADTTELGATLDHDKHTGECTRCHALTTSAVELRLPHGHAACTGSGCHVAGGGPAPALDDCRACHALGRADARLARRDADPWSVRKTFSHARHTNATCTACHEDLHGADVVQLATPTKPTCAPCHDGTAAFSLTGTTCRKCHSR